MDLDTIRNAADYIRGCVDELPEAGIILGTGLGSLTDNLIDKKIIPYRDIPGFPVSTAPSHKGQFLAGSISGKNVIVMQGRFHFYEGYAMEQVTFPIRVMKELGIKNLIITNAAGSLREHLQPGSIVLISDHINFMGTNPLIGPNEPYFGDRFPSMNDSYSSELRELALTVGAKEGIELNSGVYIAVTGPSLETVAECRAFALWGADMVGMSTVPEVITAVHSDIRVLGISIITNLSNLFHQQSHLQQEIQDNALQTYPKLRLLIERLLESI